MFTKENYMKWIEDPSNIELNKQMIEEFPFLLPRNRWTGEASEVFDYTYNELSFLDAGWKIAFGYEMLVELKAALEKNDYLYKYRITDIKEKYGTLRWYDAGAPEGVFEVIKKYMELSEYVCIVCGEPATHVTRGWISFYCKDCGERFGAEPIEEERPELEGVWNEIYPLTIIADRYGGTYSGGTFLAFNMYANEIPVEVDGSDTYCQAFWNSNKDLLVGRGTTPDAAYIDLFEQIKDY